MALHLDKFYRAVGMPVNKFSLAMEQDFIKTLTDWKIFGGASTSERKKAIQEAVDALEIYRNLGYPEGAVKQSNFHAAFKKHYRSEELPQPSPSVRAVVQNMKKIEAHYNIVMKKFMLLDYWEAVAVGTTEPELPEDGAHWSLHFFLNYDPLKVRPILELMLEDAKSILSKPYSTSLETWRGADASSNFEFTKDSMSLAIKAEAAAKVGVEVKGQFDMEYKGFKMHADAELFAGARASATGELNLTPSSLDAKGSVEVEVGIRFKSNVNIDVLDILEIEASVDGIAGALAKAEAEISISETGVKLKVSAEAFAGVKITGQAAGKLKFGGREIMKGTAKASASAGIGASAEAHFECDIFGKVGFGAKAGATLGLGAEAGAALSIDFHNARWGAYNLFWAAVNDTGFKNKGKVWFLPLEENVEMCRKSREAMFKMLGGIYQNNEAQIAKLDTWNVLESKVATAVKAKNPSIESRLRRLGHVS